MKDETGGKQIKEFVGLRSKLYSYKMYEGKETKKCKGIKKNVIRNKLTHEDYKNCLFARKPKFEKLNNIKSREHNIYTEKINKVALSCEDDKRFICEDGIHTFALGHYKMSCFDKLINWEFDNFWEILGHFGKNSEKLWNWQFHNFIIWEILEKFWNCQFILNWEIGKWRNENLDVFWFFRVKSFWPRNGILLLLTSSLITYTSIPHEKLRHRIHQLLEKT